MNVGLSTAEVDGKTALSPRSRLVRVIVASLLSDVTFWMMVPLLSLRLVERGVDPVAIGFLASVPWAVLMLSAPLAPRLVARLGAMSTLRLSLALEMMAVVGFAFADSYGSLCVANALLGLGFGLSWVVTDSWVCGTAEASSRGRLIGLYETLSSGAMGLGPLLIVVVGVAGGAAFVFGGLLVSAAFVVTLGVENERALATKRVKVGDMLRCFRSFPVIFLSAFLCGALEEASITLLPVYGVGLGYSVESAALLASVLGLGSLAIVYPMGALSDRFGLPIVQLGSLLFLVVGLVAMLAFGSALLILLPVVFLWGGMVASLQAATLVETGGAARGEELVIVIAGIMTTNTLGSVLGPIIGGAGLSIDSEFGLFWALLVIAVVVAALILFFRSRGVEQNSPKSVFVRANVV